MNRLPPLIGWGSLAGLLVAMLVWTWGTWPNAFVDFGRELYTAWRLAEGEVLYRDIAWFNGPLSAYRNALLFVVFGPGLRTLVVANGVDVVLLVLVLHALLRRVADRTGAVAACAVFLGLFAFARIDAIGNDNFLTPYSHELTHGVVLSLVALWVFRALGDRPRWAAAVSGALLGLVALTKVEPFVAGAAGLVCAFALDAHARRTPALESALRFGLLLAGMAIPIAASVVLLGLAMPAGDALRGTLGAWPAVFASDVTSQYFYRATLGIVDLDENVLSGLSWTAAWALVAGTIALVCLRVRPSPGPLTGSHVVYYSAVGSVTGVMTFAFGTWLSSTWPDFVRPLPIFVGLLALGAILQALRSRDPRAGTSAALLVFSTLLLAKVLLRVRLDQYGFALAMPGTLLVVVAGVSWLPHWIRERGGDGRLARAATLGVVAAVAFSLLPWVDARIRERHVPIGTGADSFLTDPTTAAALNDTLAALSAREAPASGDTETLVVLPEGVMINYLARRVNPTGHINFMPPELVIFGEDRILDRIRDNPPDLLALTHKDTREYGVGFFGRGYGHSIHEWAMTNYRPIETFGDVPLQPGSRFGITLLERITR